MPPIVTALWNFPANHPIAFAAICSGAATGAQWTWNSFIGALPAPTATSTEKYKFWFRFFNLMAANIDRAKLGGPRVEDSPNFVAAVNIQNEKDGVPKVVVPMQEPKP